MKSRLRGHGFDRGFTIIETIIVLTVTGVMFLLAALAFNGQQAKTQFSQTTRDIESKMLDIANDVTAGYFPQTDDWRCQATASGPSITSGISSGQGTNDECIFIGKAVQFGPDDNDCDNNCTSMRIVTVIGNRKTSGNNLVTSLAQALPGTAPDESPFNELYQLKFGLGVYRLLDQNGVLLPASGVAFLSSLGNYSSGDAVAGSQTTGMYRVAGSLGSSAESFDDQVENLRGSNAVSAVTLCMRDSTSGGRRAALVLTQQPSGVGTQTLLDEAVPGGCND